MRETRLGRWRDEVDVSATWQVLRGYRDRAAWIRTLGCDLPQIRGR